jgi:phosphate transport system protein
LSRREHTSQHYEQQLRKIRDRLLVMSGKVEGAIHDAMRALVERRPSLADEVIARDDEIDQMELEIDNLTLQTLALEQPVAGDLRFLATALKIVRDIERVGDIAVNSAERAREIMTEPELKPLVDLPIMSQMAEESLKKSLDAFVNGDVEAAERVIRDDVRLDYMYEQILRELLTYMLEDRHTISRCVKLVFIAKGLERVGDHAANIAEMVVFLVRGEDIRHGTGVDS